ncbi:EVE domain-containing protein [bacterium]|jgi:predicted RNA-binding protein with PUA-like domain|nr:EVE domain-containing protein [bacterium]
MNYWLMKCEPNVYSIDDLIKDGVTQWEGVRNYQARNFMRDRMKIGDIAFFYHSNSKPSGIIGLCEVCKESYPDYFAWDESSKYCDPKSSKENPRWFMVDVKFKQKFRSLISLKELKEHEALSDMMVVQKGSRLSINPVEKKHVDYIMENLVS